MLWVRSVNLASVEPVKQDLNHAVLVAVLLKALYGVTTCLRYPLLLCGCSAPHRIFWLSTSVSEQTVASCSGGDNARINAFVAVQDFFGRPPWNETCRPIDKRYPS
jgi:hypothetical protein